MNTRNFFAFIDFVYAFNGHKRTVDAFFYRKKRFANWVEEISNKRRKFEACAFTCYVQSSYFQKEVLIYYNKLKKSLDGYQKSHWFDKIYDIKTNRREYWEQRYHEVRMKEIKIAFNYLHELIHGVPRSTINVVSQKYFKVNYTEEQLNDIYNGLVKDGYLREDTKINDFIYFFSGKGEIPTELLEWKSTKGKLALFIDYFVEDNKNKWVITANIFKGTIPENLKNSLNTEKNNGREDFFKTFENKWIKKITK